jgi:hypothetical protein
VDYLMIKRALLAGAAILGVCFSLLAQETAIQPVSFNLNRVSPGDMVEGRAALQGTGSFSTLNKAWYGSGPLTLADRRLFSFPSAFGWVEAPSSGFLPAFTAEELPRMTPAETLARDPGVEAVDLLHKFDYVGGEVGVFYGRSTGKFNREVEQGYIFGEMVDGNTHIGVGAFYEHSSGSVPRIPRAVTGQ